MKRSAPLLFFRLLCLTLVFISLPQHLFGQNEPAIILTLLSPPSGTVSINKTPDIRFRSSHILDANNLLILLDGNDISALVNINNGIYSYEPIAPLDSGEHNLYIGAYTTEGIPVEKEFFFSTRQSKLFEDFYSTNQVSATLKTVLKKDTSSSNSDTFDTEAENPHTTLDTYLTSETAAREGNWDNSAKVDIRYYDQNTALQNPEKKGLSLLDFLLTANYTGETTTFYSEIGDTSIEESQNTIDYLTRRGGQASVSIANITLNGFAVLGSETGYEIDGLGFGFNSNDHIMGTSLKLSFFDQQMSVKGIYARGGEQGDSFGTWSDTEGRKGDVSGIVLSSDFFNQLLATDFEFDVVNYNYDTDDGDDTVYDKAYRIRFSGLTNIYDYELSYNYSGPEYEVVGNQSIIRDWAGIDFSGGMTYPTQAVRIVSNYFWDNVENDSLYARLHSFTTGIDYKYSGWKQFPISLFFEHNKQRSSDEPLNSDFILLDTNSLTGSISFIEGPWAIEFMSSYSEQNDTTETDYDTRLFTLSAAPTYSSTFFSILPSWNLNNSTDLSTNVTTETNTLTMDIYSSSFNDTITCELGGTFDWTITDDDSTDLSNTDIYARINYRLVRLWWLEDPTIAIEYHHNLQKDNIYESTSRENIFTLVISTAIPYSF